MKKILGEDGSDYINASFIDVSDMLNAHYVTSYVTLRATKRRTHT